MSVPVQLNGPSISIHPPRVGWDWHQTARGSDPSISIHPPRVGWDLPTDSAECDLEISIHPPRVGWDSGSPSWRALLWYFNPPTPCGVGRKGRCWLKRPIATISIHPPRVGWDQGIKINLNEESKFQSTHPVWGGTRGMVRIKALQLISIHPPRVGWDLLSIRSISRFSISIHPPRVGWDREAVKDPLAIVGFQSTHPVWGGTETASALHYNQPDFNPPTPCGVGPGVG